MIFVVISVNSAQIEIKLRYCPDESALEIGILRARNLHALYIDMGTEVLVFFCDYIIVFM